MSETAPRPSPTLTPASRNGISSLGAAIVGWFRPLFEVETGLGLLYLALAFPLGLAWFVASVTLLATGFGLLIVWVGAPILLALLLFWRGAAAFERLLAKHLAGVEIASPYRPIPSGRLIERARAILTDPATWRDPVYLVLRFPLGLITFIVLTVLISVTAAMVASPVLVAADVPIQLFVNDDRVVFEVNEWWESGVVAAIGVLALGAVAHLVRFGAAGHGVLAAALLAPSRTVGLEIRVDDLTDQRDRGFDVASAERRRIERDLHDGAQQRLVALAMELGRARRKLDVGDTEAVRELLEGAHTRSKEALVELRDLARGIHPAILTDRGLDAALSSLAARAPFPVEINYGPPARLPESVESTAYFMAAEALTNVSKHAAASRAVVSVEELDGLVVLEVFDDGVGGVDPEGSGMRGLADRLAAAGGRLEIESPIGGPTIVRGVLPCVW